MDPVLLATAVMVLVQGIKAIFEKWNVTLKDSLAIILTVVVCMGEVVNATLDAGKPLIVFATLWLFVKVLVGALGSYSLIGKIAGKKTA